MIRFLQLSDIHFHNTAPDDDDFAQMKCILPKDVSKQTQRFGNVDHILVCGDIAFSGEQSQYEEAENFISEIKTNAGCDSVFVVPGNHDLDRNVYEQLKEAVRDYAISHESFLSNCRAKEPLVLKSLYSQFKDYYLFASKYNNSISISDIARKMLPEWGIDTSSKEFKDSYPQLAFQSTDKFYWKSNLGTENGYSVNLYGVNTAIWASKNDYIDKNTSREQLFPKQMWNVTRDYDSEINILMAHHPYECLVDGKKLSKRVYPFFNVQVFGHVHRQKIQNEGSVIIQSGALQPDEKNTTKAEEYFPIYNIIEITVEHNQVKVVVHSRKWNGVDFEDYQSQINPQIVPIKPNVKSNQPQPDQSRNKPKTIIISEQQLRLLFIKQISKETQVAIMKEMYPSDLRLNLLIDSKDEAANYYALLYFFGKARSENKLDALANTLKKYIKD